MTFLVFALLLMGATFFVVRPAMAGGNQISLIHFDGRGVVLAFVGVTVVSLFFGMAFSLAMLAAWLVKELGHALGQRLAGHADMRLRLVPLSADGNVRSRNDFEAFFVLLMGPGVSLAPMVVAFAIGAALEHSAPSVAYAARSYALAAGALNFIMLLPIWPLPGAHLLRLIVQARFPQMSGLAAAALAALVFGMSLTAHSALLFLLGIVAALALAFGRGPTAENRPRLTRAQVRIGFTAYFATLSAFFLAGWWVLTLGSIGF